MEFGLSEEQHLLVDSLDSLCAEAMPLDTVRACAADAGESLELHRHLVQLGIPGVMIAEEFGGSGLSLLDGALIAEVFGKHVAQERIIGGMLASIALPGSGLDAELSAIAAGDIAVSFGFTEYLGAREGARLALDKDGKLSGNTIFVRTEAAATTGACRLLLATPEGDVVWVNPNADSGAIQAAPLTTIDKTRNFAEYTFNSMSAVRLAKAGDPLIDELVCAARVLIAADTFGAACAMLDKAVAYSLERKQFGRLIGSFQAVKHLCAEMAAQLEPCRSLLWYAGHARAAAPDDFQLTACHLKALLDDVGRFVARTATEVHGGMGFTDLLGLHFWFKRIGVNRQWLGGPEQVRAEAAVHSGYIKQSATFARG